MTDQELKDLVASLSASTAELRAAQAESQKEQDKSRKELDETWRQIRQVGKQLGELGNKFGSFTEGLALPSMEKVFARQFGLKTVQPRARSSRNGRTLEIDVLAYDYENSDEVYIVEVKSHLKEEGIDQLLQTIEDFPNFFPWLSDRILYGVIAAVDVPDNLRQKVWQKGLYLARISDETFKLQVPPGFKPKAFGPAAAANGNGHKRNDAKKRSRK